MADTTLQSDSDAPSFPEPPLKRRRLSDDDSAVPDLPATPDAQTPIKPDPDAAPADDDEQLRLKPLPVPRVSSPASGSGIASPVPPGSTPAHDSDYYTDQASSPIPLPEQDGQDAVDMDPSAPQLRYKPKLVLRGHKRAVAAVRFSPDGKLLASASADATAKIWDAATGKPLHTLTGHLAGLSTLSWTPDSTTLATGADDKAIRLWSAQTGRPYARPFLGHHNYITALSISPKGNILASGSTDEAVFLWDVRSRSCLRALPAHGDPVGGLDFSHDGTLIVSCASDGLVRIWDVGTGQCLRTFFHEDTPAVGAARFSPNSLFVATWMLDGSVRLWNYIEQRARCVKTYQGHVNARFALSGAFGVYVPPAHESSEPSDGADDADEHDGEDQVMQEEVPEALEARAFLVSGSEDGALVFWDVASKAVLAVQRGRHAGVVFGVDYASGGSGGGVVASCGQDRTIVIWREEPLS